MRSTLTWRRVLLASTLGLFAACTDSEVSSPPLPGGFDAVKARDKVEPISAVFDDDVFVSFTLAGRFFDPFFRSQVATTTPVVVPPPIPPDALGKTFVFDPATHAYVADASATDGPALGARFLLYAWSVQDGQPALPLRRIGHVDFVRVGPPDASPSVTQVLVVRDTPQRVVANLAVAHDTTSASDTFGILGSAFDGRTTVDINVSGTYVPTVGHRRLAISSTLSSTALGVRAHEQLVFDQTSPSEEDRLELTYDGHTLTDVPVAPGSEVKFDGQLYVRILPTDPPSFTVRYLRPDGSSLSTREIADLDALLIRVTATQFLWQDLAWP